MCSTQMFTYGTARNGSLLCTCPCTFAVPSGTSVIGMVGNEERRGTGDDQTHPCLVAPGVGRSPLPVEVVVPADQELQPGHRPDPREPSALKRPCERDIAAADDDVDLTDGPSPGRQEGLVHRLDGLERAVAVLDGVPVVQVEIGPEMCFCTAIRSVFVRIMRPISSRFRFCWCGMLWSVVISISYAARSATVSRSPLLIVSHPWLSAVRTLCSGTFLLLAAVAFRCRAAPSSLPHRFESFCLELQYPGRAFDSHAWEVLDVLVYAGAAGQVLE